MCLDKQQIKDAIDDLFFSCYFAIGPKILCQIVAIHMASDPDLFFVNL